MHTRQASGLRASVQTLDSRDVQLARRRSVLREGNAAGSINPRTQTDACTCLFVHLLTYLYLLIHSCISSRHKVHMLLCVQLCLCGSLSSATVPIYCVVLLHNCKCASLSRLRGIGRLLLPLAPSKSKVKSQNLRCIRRKCFHLRGDVGLCVCVRACVC